MMSAFEYSLRYPVERSDACQYSVNIHLIVAHTLFNIHCGILLKHTLDMFDTCINYLSMDLHLSDTTCNLVYICWIILNDIMSQYYLNKLGICGLNGVLCH